MSVTNKLLECLAIAFGGALIAFLFLVFVGLLMLSTQPETECETTNIEWRRQ